MITLTWVRGMNALKIPDEHIVGIGKDVKVKQRVHIWSSLVLTAKLTAKLTGSYEQRHIVKLLSKFKPIMHLNFIGDNDTLCLSDKILNYRQQCI